MLPVYVVHANLDAEAAWAGTHLPTAILKRASYYASLTAALAPDGVDAEVWTPAEIEAARLAFPVTMRAGTPARADLVWARADAKAANDRRLAVALAAEHGIGVPGARTIASADEIAIDGAWVAKAPWTTAGRDRCHGRGAPTAEQRTRIARLVAAHGALVLEPWLDRAFDVGVCAEGDTIHAPHGLVTDARGTFLGIDLAPPPLTAEHRAELRAFVAAAVPRLPYAGPLAVDAFVTTGGRLCVCEINARYSFGWVARALAQRHGTTRLGFSAAPPGATVLIRPAGDGVTAWIA